MDGKMVLRRLPAAILLCLLALVIAAPVASADRWHDDDPGYADASGDYGDGDGGYVDDGTDDTDGGGYYDDGSGDTGGAVPVATTPAVTLTPAVQPPAPSADDDDTLDPTTALPTVPVTKTIAGKVARLRTDGKAAIPRGAPQRVQALIAAANRIVGKPYKWGGGHAKLADAGYDCSGAVSYALIGAGLLGSPMVSGTLARWQAAGNGRWLSIYANKGHVYLEVAGLRLDTSAVGDPRGRSGVRWRPVIGRRAGFHTRHVAGF